MPLIGILFLLTPVNLAELTVPITPYVDVVEEAKNVWQSALADCESDGNPTIKVLDTNGYYSYGKYQYQMVTWLKYKDLGATKENIYSEELQDKVTRHVLETKGSDDWWNCTKILDKSAGPFPQ